MPSSQSQSLALHIAVGVQCHVGKGRTENQDRVTRVAIPFGDLFVVADGVGGYQGGSEAAQAAVDGFVGYLNAHGTLTLSDALQQAARRVSNDLEKRSAANQALHGMGSTVVLCVIHGSRATYAHVGDSRLYLLRNRRLQQLTRDHSVMERLISQGVLTPAQARVHPDSSVLTRALGQSADVALDIAEIALLPNDALLLCSDGLWAYAQHAEMEAIAASENLSASAVSAALLNLALEGGGGDNISIQFIRFETLETQGRNALMLGMPHNIALPAVGLALIVATAAIVMTVWNYQHPMPVHKPSVNAPSSASPTQAPEQPKPLAQEPKPSAISKTATRKPTTQELKSKETKKTPPAAPQPNPEQTPAAPESNSEKTPPPSSGPSQSTPPEPPRPSIPKRIESATKENLKKAHATVSDKTQAAKKQASKLKEKVDSDKAEPSK